MPQFPSFVDALPVTHDALEFAAEHHEGQRRESDDAAFILHPLEVAQLLRGRGYPDEVVAAGVLHDSLEDTDATPLELEQRFGSVVAALVCSVSEPAGGGSYAQRKARLRSAMTQWGPSRWPSTPPTRSPRCASCGMTLARDWSAAVRPETADRLHHYWASLALLESLLDDDPLVSQLRFELEALATLPPRTPGTLPVAQHAGS